MTMDSTQIAIIGGGPSGLLLSHILHRAGIESVVLERRSRDYVLSRIRAGVMEHGLVTMLRSAGVGARMDHEGYFHDGFEIADGERRCRIDLKLLTGGAGVTVYGQTEVTRDLYGARESSGGDVRHDANVIGFEDIDSSRPTVIYQWRGMEYRLACRFIAGCDGYYGVSRAAVPEAHKQVFERIYPFGWLGVLSETKPVSDELLYARHDRGFALCSMRNERLSRYYIQRPISEKPEEWPDEAFWDELRRRLPTAVADHLETGPSIEKSIAPLRSFVCEPMRYQSLFLCGDAAHIVPPTGAKGLNLAASDVYYLSEALIAYFNDGDRCRIDQYSQRALARVWKAERFSWWMTSTLHLFPEQDAFAQRMQTAELDYLFSSHAAQQALAENYVGLPF